ncbi:cation diffusion facilitator family transporter [Sulfurimonas sp. HSL-1716]|uniref:cation diffusion facilitator family transporter n=1 Tax=Hydrocurvibacter sulfurireducens TaxID=3131937 RepID=UPI0031F81134
MSQHHHHHHHVSGKNLLIAIILNLTITLSQVIGGIFSGSLALLSDALHNFSDVLTLLIAYVANRLSHKEHTESKTFGYRRAEIIAAFFNTSVLMAVAIFLIYESYQKLINPQSVDSLTVVWLGVLSIFLNALGVLLVKDDAHHNMNIKAAYLHLLTDMVTSVAVVAGGLLMYFYQIYWVDPLVSMIIALYLIVASWSLMKVSLSVLMQFTPEGIAIQDIINKIKETQNGIENVHHVHLWQLDDHSIHLEAHLNFQDNISLQECSAVLDSLEKVLKKDFGVTHTTFQCEHNRCQVMNAIV